MEFPSRLEYCGAIYSGTEGFLNVLLELAFHTMRERWLPAYCGVLEGAISRHHASKTLSHVMVVAPFVWGDWDALTLPSRTITWLQLLPISDAEYQFAKSVSGD